MVKTDFLKRCNDFFSKWNGKNDDFDGSYPNECVDTAKRFMFEVCGIDKPPATGNGWASGYWINKSTIPAIKNNFYYITNPDLLEMGDIVITSHPHVAIYNDGRLFGQNHGGKHEPNGWVDFRAFKTRFLGALRFKYSTTDKDRDAYYKCAMDVIRGRYGNGHDVRKKAIYEKVRAEVNKNVIEGKFTGGYISDIAFDVINGYHGNGHDNRAESIYKLVREWVNKIV